MKQEDRDRLFRKLDALLQKADPENGATEAEALAAMAKAQELMEKHGLEEAEIRATGKSTTAGLSSKDIKKHDFDTGTIYHTCYRHIFHVIFKMTGVRMIRSKYVCPKKNKLLFRALLIGTEEDIRIARILFLPMKNLMRRMPAKRAKQMGVKHTCAFENSYYDGAMAGILEENERVKAACAKEASAAANQEWGIVLVKKDAIVKQWIEENIKTIPARKSTSGRYDPAYDVGRRDGADLKIHKAVQ